MTPKVPYITPLVRSVFNGTTEKEEIEIDRAAPDQYWECVGIDKQSLPWLKDENADNQ